MPNTRDQDGLIQGDGGVASVRENYGAPQPLAYVPLSRRVEESRRYAICVAFAGIDRMQCAEGHGL